MNKVFLFLICISFYSGIKFQTSEFTICENFSTGEFKENNRNSQITQNKGYRIDTISNYSKYEASYNKKTWVYTTTKCHEYGFSLKAIIGKTNFFLVALVSVKIYNLIR